MKKFVNKLLTILAIYAAGMMTMGIYQIVDVRTQQRSGIIGGEIFILPMMISLIYIGYLIGRMFFETFIAHQIYKKGFLQGLKNNENGGKTNDLD